jgi:hypothetical protein
MIPHPAAAIRVASVESFAHRRGPVGTALRLAEWVAATVGRPVGLPLWRRVRGVDVVRMRDITTAD